MEDETLITTLYAGFFSILGAFCYAEFYKEENIVENFVNDIKEKVSVHNSFFADHNRSSMSSIDTLFIDDFSRQEVSDSVSVINDSLERVVSSRPDCDAVKKEFESKRVPVLMFHRLGEREDRYTVSPGNFERLLHSLYVNDFYSVSLEEFLDGDFSSVPVGKKPVLITFDDAHVSQFRLNSDGSVCGRSAVGVMESFYETYDFGSKPVFFVSFGGRNNFSLPFGQKDVASDKMKFLVDNGYGVGYHTVFHDNNTNASRNNVLEQYVLSSSLFHNLLGSERFESIRSTKAHPFGAVPTSEVVFDYMVEKYSDGLFNAWGGPSRHPLSSNFDIYRIPRIEITYHSLRSLVLNVSNLYEVTPETKKFYDFLNNKTNVYEMKALEVKGLNK